MKKTKTQKTDSKKKQSVNESKKENIIRRYYPIFESLILFILDYAKWWKAFRSFVKDELDYRAGLAVQTLIYFIMGSTFLGFSLIWILLGSYFWLKELLESPHLAAFSVGGIFFLLGFVFLFFMSKISQKIFEANEKKESTNDFDSFLDD